MNLKEIKELIQLMEEHGLSEVDLEKDGTKIRLKKGASGHVELSAGPVGAPVSSDSSSSSQEQIKEVEKIDENCVTVLSPMVGTFYRQSAPGVKPYAEIGDRVSEGQVLCILEAMKLMNEVKSEHNGVIEQIMVENLQAVEFGQPLFIIRKS